MYCEAYYLSPLGWIKIKAEGKYIIALYFVDGEENFTAVPEENETIDKCMKQLDEYFHGSRVKFSIPFKLYGTPFQEEVWNNLQSIPYGRTKSYKDIAKKIGSANLSRAVGQTNALNPVAIIVPCHRVIGSNGDLTGYAGGVDRKKWLLDFEQKFFQPKLF